MVGAVAVAFVCLHACVRLYEFGSMNRSERSRSPPPWHQWRELLAARAHRLQLEAVAALAAAEAAVAAAAVSGGWWVVG